MSEAQVSAVRELFVEELTEVKGGNPIEWLEEQLGGGGATTYACCEEGYDNCCEVQPAGP